MELSTTTLTIFAVFAMMGLVGVVGVTIVWTMENVEAKGCSGTTPGFNASKGRCFH